MSGDSRNGGITVQGAVTGSVLVAGDNNTVKDVQIAITLPAASDVDPTAELRELREMLAALSVPQAGKIDRALDDAAEELDQPTPDKAEMAAALERALGYAKKADSFTEQAEKIAKRVGALAVWLGDHGKPLLALLGIT